MVDQSYKHLQKLVKGMMESGFQVGPPRRPDGGDARVTVAPRARYTAGIDYCAH